MKLFKNEPTNIDSIYVFLITTKKEKLITLFPRIKEACYTIINY